MDDFYEGDDSAAQAMAEAEAAQNDADGLAAEAEQAASDAAENDAMVQLAEDLNPPQIAVYSGMVEVAMRLYVSNAEDYERQVVGQPGWSIVQACKEPYHRQALGYTERGAPKDNPEYLIAYRDNRMILNMIDVENPEFFNRGMILQTMFWIEMKLHEGKVLVHCNQGISRGPSLALLFMAVTGEIKRQTYEVAAEDFRRHLYPAYQPSAGIKAHLSTNWTWYHTEFENGDLRPS